MRRFFLQTYNKQNVGRMYVTPKGDFPSVTTVLGASGDHAWLDEWRERVGAEKADSIVKESIDIGNHLHYLFECLFDGNTPKTPATAEEKKALQMFRFSKPKLLAFIEEVTHMEVAVYSSKLRIAGRFDMMCITKDGKVALVDYKNSRRNKTREEIETYRQQLALYRIMIKETLGIEVQEMIVFMVLREGFVKKFVFKEEDTDFEELVKIRKTFYLKFGF